MSTKRMYLVMILVSALLTVGVLGSLLMSLSVLKRHSNELVAVKLENRVLDEQQASLVAAKKAIDTYADLDKIARAVVPQDKDQANSVRSITSIADSLGIKLSAINFPPSTLGQSLKTSKKTVTQVTPVLGLKGVYQMEITVQSDTSSPITYPKFLDFLTKLETNRRTAQVSSITILPTAADRNKLTFSLGLDTYIKP